MCFSYMVKEKLKVKKKRKNKNMEKSAGTAWQDQITHCYITTYIKQKSTFRSRYKTSEPRQSGLYYAHLQVLLLSTSEINSATNTLMNYVEIHLYKLRKLPANDAAMPTRTQDRNSNEWKLQVKRWRPQCQTTYSTTTLYS